MENNRELKEMIMADQKLTAILVDDEDRARNSLRLLIQNYCPEVEIVAEAANVPEAVLAINKHEPQVVFLDIEMPEYNGFELFGFFKQVDFNVVFVTAYDQYAIKAFEVSAIDYLLKPVDIDQLMSAVQKVRDRAALSTIQDRLELMQENYQKEDIRRIALPKSDGLFFVDVNDIVVIEADGAYSTVWLKDKSKILVSKKLRFFEDILHNRRFFYRSHRSFIANLNYIEKYVRADNLLKMETGQSVSLSRDRKSEFEQLLRDLGLAS
jgi:two-component system LytT family response regulator